MFAEPDHADGRELLADVLEQLGFGSENGTWRAPTCPGRWNCGPAISGPTVTTSADILGQLIPELFFDAVAIQVNGPAAWDLDLTIRWDFPDHGGAYRTTLHNGVFSYVRDESGQVQVTVTVPSAALGPLAVGDVSGATAAGLTLDGDGTALERLLSVVQPGDIAFNIVEP